MITITLIKLLFLTVSVVIIALILRCVFTESTSTMRYETPQIERFTTTTPTLSDNDLGDIAGQLGDKTFLDILNAYNTDPANHSINLHTSLVNLKTHFLNYDKDTNATNEQKAMAAYVKIMGQEGMASTLRDIIAHNTSLKENSNAMSTYISELNKHHRGSNHHGNANSIGTGALPSKISWMGPNSSNATTQ